MMFGAQKTTFVLAVEAVDGRGWTHRLLDEDHAHIVAQSRYPDTDYFLDCELLRQMDSFMLTARLPERFVFHRDEKDDLNILSVHLNACVSDSDEGLHREFRVVETEDQPSPTSPLRMVYGMVLKNTRLCSLPYFRHLFETAFADLENALPLLPFVREKNTASS